MTRSRFAATVIILLGVSLTLQGADGVYIGGRLEDATAVIEGRQLVLRQLLTATSTPNALGILLVDAHPGAKLISERGSSFVVTDRSVSRAPYRIYVILEKQPDLDVELRLQLNDQVFWDVEPKARQVYPPRGWISFPVTKDQNPDAILRAAGAMFDVPETQRFDLRLTDVQRAQSAGIKGEFSRDEVDQIRQLVALQATEMILDRLAEAPPAMWPKALEQWPGRYPFQLRGDRRYASAYYAPNCGYQLEKSSGKWAIVGG